MATAQQLGINIREIRRQKKLTQQELAEKSGFSLQHVGDIERGQANPTLSCLQKLAEVMQVNVADFFVALRSEEPNYEEIRRQLQIVIEKASKHDLAMLYGILKGYQ